MSAQIRGYTPADREACRRLWVELTEWHRELFGTPTIGGDDPASSRDWRGRGVGAALAGFVIEVARMRGNRRLVTKPVARNEDALRFFHALGFEVLSQVELIADLTSPEEQVWRAGAVLADRPFRL